MASISLADQLEDSIELMIAEPNSAPPRLDLKIGELLGIAAELRLLPDPEFRVALKAELVGRHHTVPVAGHLDLSLQASQSRQAWRDARLGEILPTLFGAGDGTYPVHRGNFAISAAIHAALIAVLATAGLWVTKQTELTPHATSVLLTDISSYAPPAINKSRGGGGGGDKDKLSESKGSLPRFAREQITPPTIVVRNEQPKLSAEPTVVGPPALTVPPTSPIGNPLSAIVQPPSNGAGSGSGIGMAAAGESALEKDQALALDMAVALAVAYFAWAAGFPHPAQSTILTRSIRKRLATQSTRERYCSGLSLAQMAGRTISACNGRSAWASMKKPLRQFGNGNLSPR